jgi:hypothetical protein
MQKLSFCKFHYAPSFTTLPERKFQDAINIRESSATPSNTVEVEAPGLPRRQHAKDRMLIAAFSLRCTIKFCQGITTIVISQQI